MTLQSGQICAGWNQLTIARYRRGLRPASRRLLRGTPDLAVPVIDGTPLFEMLGDRLPGVPLSWLSPPSGEWTGSPTELVYDR